MKYYVYHLIDPRDGKPFYVGKGQGNRLEAHERQARLSGDRYSSSAKCQRIRQIWAEGQPVIRQIVRYFAQEKKALLFEFEQINSIPGLTNVFLGMGGRREAREKRRALGPLRFTEEIIARVAWIVATSKGLTKEFTTELVGASALYKTIEDIFNKLGYVNFARQCIKTWADQRGSDVVRERFKPYGIDLVFSQNTETC